MEIHRVGPFTDVPLESPAAAESEPAAKGARRAVEALAPEAPPRCAGTGSPDETADSRRVESRLDAESLKVGLFARLDRMPANGPVRNPSTENAGGEPESPPAGSESSLAAGVLDYLRQHPDAADTLEGIGDWSSEAGKMPGLAAQGEAVAMDRIVIQAEGWARDEGTTESSKSPGEADGVNSADDPDRG